MCIYIFIQSLTATFARVMNTTANTANMANITINDDDNNLETECVGTVKKLFAQYPNMKQKIHHHIKNLLPGICENACHQQKEREERKNTLEEKSDEFIEEFMDIFVIKINIFLQIY